MRFSEKKVKNEIDNQDDYIFLDMACWWTDIYFYKLQFFKYLKKANTLFQMFIECKKWPLDQISNYLSGKNNSKLVFCKSMFTIFEGFSPSNFKMYGFFLRICLLLSEVYLIFSPFVENFTTHIAIPANKSRHYSHGSMKLIVVCTLPRNFNISFSILAFKKLNTVRAPL